MNELKIFAYEDDMVRTVKKDGEPWFVGKDVAKALGYKDTVNALKDHVDDEDKAGWQIATQFGTKETTIINESGLYSLIFGSRMESAKKFKRWVTHDVLPQIRKTGGYGVPKRTNEEICRDVAVTILDKIESMNEKGITGITCDVSALAIALLGKDGGARKRTKKRDENDFVLSKERLGEVAAFCDRFCDVTGNRLDSCKLTDLYGVYKRAAKERVMKRFEFKNALSELYDSVSFSAQTLTGENVLSVRGLSLKHKYWELF